MCNIEYMKLTSAKVPVVSAFLTCFLPHHVARVTVRMSNSIFLWNTTNLLNLTALILQQQFHMDLRSL